MKRVFTAAVMVLLAVLSLSGTSERAQPEEPATVYIETEASAETPAPTSMPAPTPEPTSEPTPAPEPEPTPDPEPEIPPCPLTENEYQLLAELMVCEAEIVLREGEKWGVSPLARIAAVGWTAFDRLDAGYGETLEEVIKAPYQYAWTTGIIPPEWALDLAHDIGGRWWAEKCGVEDVGRTIPAGYRWFWGDGHENYFRNQYQGGTEWDWSLPDPYKEWTV